IEAEFLDGEAVAQDADRRRLLQHQLPGAAQRVRAEAVEPSPLSLDSDPTHFHEALPAALLGIEIADHPPAEVFGLVEHGARVATFDLIVASEYILPALNIAFKHQMAVADGAIEKNAGSRDVAGALTALERKIGVQIGGECAWLEPGLFGRA